MNYMESSDEYIELNYAIDSINNRINEIDKISSELAIEKLNLQKKLDQIKLQRQNVHNHLFQNGRTCFDEYENNQNSYMNNVIDNYSEYFQILNLNNVNINPYYSSDQAMINDHVDDYFDTEFNQKMYYQQPKQVSNEKYSSFNHLNQLNQDNPIIENSLQVIKEDQTKTFMNSENSKLDLEYLPLSNSNLNQNANSKTSQNSDIQNDNIQLSIYQNNSLGNSKIQGQALESQEQKSVQNKEQQQSKYRDSIQQTTNPSSKQSSIEQQFINNDQREIQQSPQYNKLLKKNNNQNDLILQTPQQNSDDMLDYEKQQITKLKGVSGFNKRKKEKNKHFKKNSASETIKLCKYKHSQNRKTKCFTKDLSLKNSDCLSQFENSFLQNIQNLNHDELISNNKNNLSQINQKNMVHLDDMNSNNSQSSNKLKEENIEKQKQLYIYQKKQFLETLPEDSLRFQFSKQLQYLQDINLGKSTSDENNENTNIEETFENSAKKSQKSRSEYKQNSSQKQGMIDICESGVNEQSENIVDIQRIYQHFLIHFNNNKSKYTKKGKGFYRYPSTLKMKVVEFSKYFKLIQIQKDTQISQETIRKWQKRYTELPEQMVEYDFME
ncbi:hypothetical protein ABPG74_014274 [Tetrahymena malaccensis]